MTIAIIPAKGFSQRIPRKNIKNFYGKPIISHSIETAKKSGLFKHIIVSTEDPQIAEIVKEYGAEVPFMYPRDKVSDTSKAFSHVSYTLEKLGVKDNEIVCCLYATAPLLDPEYLIEGYTTFINHKYDFILAATTFEFPVYRSLRLWTDYMTVEPAFGELINERSQDLTSLYHDAGQFYWGRANTFIKNDTIFKNPENSVGAVFIPRGQCIDIDTKEDWKIAEALYTIKNG